MKEKKRKPARLQSCFCSSLAKVMPGETPANPIRHGCALRGERFSFQLAYRMDCARCMLKIEVQSPFGKNLRMRKVGLVPVEYCGTRCDKDVVSDKPGIFPDLLSCFQGENDWVMLLPTWRAVWFTVDIPEDCKPGIYEINVSLKYFWAYTEEPEYFPCGTKTFTLEVLDAAVPPQTLKNTHWFHSDCLAGYYHIPVFSEEYWRITGNFMRSAADHGQNMILTPVFTPPLDTMVGGERPTVQLVKVVCRKGKYSFDFTLLDRWIKLAEECGMKYFEISHLFTQWGAKATPKIMADVDGKEKRIFGWDVPAASKEYADFLAVFLPELTAYFKKKKMVENVYFHCSDEPVITCADDYMYAKTLMEKYLKGFKIMDALSHVDFYKNGMVKIPVPGENSLEGFLQEKLPERWTYYCCGPEVDYSNRHIYMTSSRNRIFGFLLYAYQVEGFLHWGFNFYNSVFSLYQIDPYRVNDAGNMFPAGDGFLVYPGKDGIPEDSIRFEVFYEALQDQRILQGLESRIGREKVMAVLDAASPKKKMKMNQYPIGERRVLALRHKINEMIRTANTVGRKRTK